jgi:hypothetical protein
MDDVLIITDESGIGEGVDDLSCYRFTNPRVHVFGYKLSSTCWLLDIGFCCPFTSAFDRVYGYVSLANSKIFLYLFQTRLSHDCCYMGACCQSRNLVHQNGVNVVSCLIKRVFSRRTEIISSAFYITYRV